MVTKGFLYLDLNGEVTKGLLYLGTWGNKMAFLPQSLTVTTKELLYLDLNGR